MEHHGARISELWSQMRMQMQMRIMDDRSCDEL